MVTLPPEFVSTKYPGYFWNTLDKRLYSVKVTGSLKPLKLQRANRWNQGQAGYHVSVNGDKRSLRLQYLSTLKRKKEVFPIYTESQMPLF